MKVVHFLLGRSNPDSANGVDKTVYFVAREQAAAGHRIGIFSITPLPLLQVPRVDVRTYPPRRLPLPNPRLGGKPRNPFLLPSGMATDLLDWRPDVVHFHSVHIPEAIWLSRHLRREGIPYCITPNGGLSARAEFEQSRLKKRVFSALAERAYLQRAAFLHAVSDREREDFAALRLSNPVVVAPNCIDPTSIPTIVNERVLVNRLPEVKERRILLFLGRLDPAQKGLDLLVEAWAKAHRPPNTALVFIGPSWRGGKAKLEELTRRREVEDSVFFLPPVSGREKWGVLASSDLVVQPSRWEGAPFTVLEALAMGKPVMVTEAACPDRLVSEHRAGLIIRPDVESISWGIEAVTRMSPEELGLLGENARRLVMSEYRWERTAAALAAAYERTRPGPRKTQA